MDANTNITFEQMPQALAEVLSQVSLNTLSTATPASAKSRSARRVGPSISSRTSSTSGLSLANAKPCSRKPIHSPKYIVRKLTVDGKEFDVMGPNEEF